MALKILSIVALIASIIWCFNRPDYDSVLAVVTSLSAVVALFFVRKRKRNPIKQNQVVSTHGVGLQAGGDINVKEINTKR